MVTKEKKIKASIAKRSISTTLLIGNINVVIIQNISQFGKENGTKI